MRQTQEFRGEKPVATRPGAPMAEESAGGLEAVSRKQMPGDRPVKAGGHGQSGSPHDAAASRSSLDTYSI